MSKWNKSAKPLTEQFMENEERRRQMIIQAAKRRRQKQRRLEQINENMKKNEQQKLAQYKKQKQEAYSKYLKNNMHDKYEQQKRNEKMQEQPKRDVSKWKKKQTLQQNNNIEGLDLQTSNRKKAKQKQTVEKLQSKVQNKDKAKVNAVQGKQKNKQVYQQFEKQWAEEISEQMIGSKLIDSLDLDVNTLSRGRQITKKVKQNAMVKKQQKPITVKQVQQIRNMIGYDSMLVSIYNRTEQDIKKAQLENKNQIKKQKQVEKKQLNEQEAFNNLKHKKQAKILEWANNEVEEADDLFSNCSSNKNSALNKQNVKQSRNSGSKKVLEIIPERTASNKSIQKIKKQNQNKRSNAVAPVPEKKIPQIPKNNSQQKIKGVQKEQKTKKSANKSNQQISSQKNINFRTPQLNSQERNRSISKQKQKQTAQAVLLRDKQRSLEKIRQRKFSGQRASSVSIQRKSVQQQKQKGPKTQQPFKNAKSIPAVPKPTYTVATHEQYFDVESFIKNDLVQLNEQQRKLQQQIRQIHLNNKQKVKEVQNKHQIKTNYKTSANLIKRQQNQGQYGNESEVIPKYGNQFNQDLIQDSIQRLDDLLIKRNIESRQKTNNHITEQSNLRSQTKSIINPFSKPEDLHKQILQLAENISKYENEPNEDVKGYGYQQKLKKKQKIKQQIPQQILSESKNVEAQKLKKGNEFKKQIIKMPNPPMLEYSGKNNEVVQVNFQQKQYDPEDSLETINKQKIKVNQKLKNMLFD